MITRFDNEPGKPYTSAVMKRVSAIVAATFVASTAFAQTGGDTPKKDAPKTAPAKTQNPNKAGDNVLAKLAKDAGKLPAEEKKARAENMLRELRAAVARATEALAEARRARDVQRLNCVNNALTHLKGLLKVAESSSVAMYEAMAKSNDDKANHQFTKITYSHQRGLVLGAEADSCAGVDSIFSGDTVVEVDVDPVLDDQDSTNDSLPPPPSPPPVASGS